MDIGRGVGVHWRDGQYHSTKPLDGADWLTGANWNIPLLELVCGAKLASSSSCRVEWRDYYTQYYCRASGGITTHTKLVELLSHTYTEVGRKMTCNRWALLLQYYFGKLLCFVIWYNWKPDEILARTKFVTGLQKSTIWGVPYALMTQAQSHWIPVHFTRGVIKCVMANQHS